MSKEKSVPNVQLPKDAVKRAIIGQSFAEYDLIRQHPSLFVETPALRAALDTSRPKCFLVVRRGTGKTSITFFLENKLGKNSSLRIPQVLSAADRYIQDEWDGNVH